MYNVSASKKTEKLKKAYLVNTSKKTEKLKKCYVVGADKKLIKLWGSVDKRFIHRTYTMSPNYPYARTSVDFSTWTETIKYSGDWHGNLGNGNEYIALSVFANDTYYFMSNDFDTFQYTKDGVNYTTASTNLSEAGYLSGYYGKSLTIIDGEFYFAASNDVKIVVYKSSDMANWALVGSASYRIYDVNEFYLVKGKFNGSEKFVIFYSDSYGKGIATSTDCTSWTTVTSQSDTAWSAFCKAKDGIYYTTGTNYGEYSWYLINPNGSKVLLDSIPYNSRYEDPSYIMQSLYHENYITIWHDADIWLVAKATSGTCINIKASTLDSSSYGNHNGTHVVTGESTKLVGAMITSLGPDGPWMDKICYCNSEYEWTYATVNWGSTKLSYNDLIYD